MDKKWVILLPLVLSLTGCAGPFIAGGIATVGLSATEERGLSGVANDQTLRIKLNHELTHNLPDFEDYELTVYNGRVLVTGIAENEAQKTQALNLVKETSGVNEVIDGINVSGRDGFSEYTRDAWMTTKLKATLYTDDDVNAPNYVVRTFDKIIYIFGTAQTEQEMKTVVDYAFDIKGVRKVVNLIQVRGTLAPSK